MKTPQHHQSPTYRELMEFVDGTLPEKRHHEVGLLISQSPRLQKEVALLKSMDSTLRSDITEAASKNFTHDVMLEIHPLAFEPLWQRVLKNSSNIFAMVLVLTLIGIVFVSGPGSGLRDDNIIARSIDSYSAAYSTTTNAFSQWFQQMTQPVNQTINQTVTIIPGKSLLIGLAALFIFFIVDETLGKKYFHFHRR